MNQALFRAAFAAGLLALGWIAAGYATTSPLALLMTLLIAAFYAMGALELRRFGQATRSLEQALAASADSPPALGPWLARLHPALQQPVRQRIEAGFAPLPGPATAPYLAGLLVLLGMLGTFLGMVATLRGTGVALETATDVSTIRASLAAPVLGLGLAFGTSVAGVAASAMLGLMTTLSRRERARVAQRLDAAVATTLRPFSRAHQRDAAFALLQRQAEAMPALAERIQAAMDQLERHSRELGERLVAAQAEMQGQSRDAHAALAQSLNATLGTGLADSARLAGAAIQPVVEATLAGVAREASSVQQGLAQAVQQQLDGLARSFEQRSAALIETVTQSQAGTQQALAASAAALARDTGALHEHIAATAGRQLADAAARFEQQAAALLHGIDEAQRAQQAQLASADAERLAAWTRSLDASAAALQQQWQQAGAQNQAQMQATLAEVGRLMQAAAEAPQAAAQVIGELRQQLSDSLQRDNAALAERERLLQTVGTLLDGIDHASGEQRAAIDALLASTTTLMERAGDRFAQQVEAETARMTHAAAQISAGSVEVASLGEAFGQAVQLFGDSSRELLAQLQRIESALGQTLARSDDQLAYYVAQARELVDLSVLTQKRVIDDLQQLARRPAPAARNEAA